MTTSTTCINNLASESLAHIFVFLLPDERVRLERVCRQWRQVAKKYAWTEFRTLTLDGNELEQRGDKAKHVKNKMEEAEGLKRIFLGRDMVLWLSRRNMDFSLVQRNMLAKYMAIIDRCGPFLRELNFVASSVCFVPIKWAMMRNLRHLRFEADVCSDTLRAVADNFKCLQSINFYNIHWCSVTVLHDLFRVNNASLKALYFPVTNSRGDSLRLPALPSSLRLLHIRHGPSHNNSPLWLDEWTPNQIDNLLELADSCCPELAILMLPIPFGVTEMSLAKLARFEKLFYLRLRFSPSDANILVFANLLKKIGPQLRALLLQRVDSRVLHLIAEHCPLLEHFSFEFHEEGEGLLSAIQSVFQLPHLRSVSFQFYYFNRVISTQVQLLAAISGLNAKGNLEYLHLPWPLPVEFIINLIQININKVTCAIQHNHTPAELGKLNTLLQNTYRSLELELLNHCPPELEMGENNRVRVKEGEFPESISEPMFRQFWARAMDSVPDLIDMDD